MKRLLSLLLTLWVALYSYAYDFQYEGICYNITDAENKLVSVTSNEDKYSGEITIPSEIESEGTTYTVTSIGNAAFNGCNALTSIIIPESVTTIGNNAFYGCFNLANISLPENLTSIGSYAFFYCTALENISLPKSVNKLGEAAFIYSGITSITIPENIKSIANKLFYSSNLTSVTLSNGITTIGESAFENCTKLSSITVPNSVISIGNSAFAYCSALKDITIPESVKTIGNNLFANSGLTSFTIPNSWSSIGDGVFHGCWHLENISIPSNIKSIGEKAFHSCQSLSSITIPSSVTNIGQGVFEDCTRLSSVKLPNTITSIPPDAFFYCLGLTSIDIPNSVETIENSAFGCCSSLTKVNIPNSVKTIGNFAFRKCTGLLTITLPSSVTAIGIYAFADCSSLCELTCLAEAVPKTGANVFEGVNCPDGTLYVPNASVSAYSTADQWKEWGNLTGTEPEEQPTAIELTDGTTYTNGRNTELTSLTFSKTFSSSAAGNWNAFYVPMSVNVEDYAGELDFAEIYAFCAMKDTNGDGTIDANDENFLSVCPVKTGCTKPNVPYLIRPREAKTYIINSADNVLYAAAQGIVEFSTARDKFTVTGLYEPLTVVAGDNNYYVSSTGSLDYRTTGSTTVKANRWVMHRESKEYGGGSGNAAASSTYRIVAIGEDIDELTAIKMINAANESGTTNTEIYSLDGRKVNNTRSLRNGLYIKNGQKIIVK